MPGSFAGLPLVDPRLLELECRDRGLPTAGWFGRANSFRCPLGPDPATGLVLMRKRDLDRVPAAVGLDWEGDEPRLVLTDPAGRTASLRCQKVSSRCVTPGWSADPAAVYAVELADRRWWLARGLSGGDTRGGAYNLREPDGTEATGWAAGPTAKTWEEVAEDCWGRALGTGAGAPAYPGLPFAPGGDPGPFDYTATRPWAALTHLLDRLACRVRVHPTTGAWSIVRAGAGDAAGAAAEAGLAAARVWSDYPGAAAGLTAAGVAVWSRLYPPGGDTPPGDGSSPYHEELAAGTAADPAGESAALYDDLPALGDGAGGFTNAAALTARAAERRDDYERVTAVAPAVAVYAGVRPAALDALGPGRNEAAFRDLGDGPKTELAYRPWDPFTDWRPAENPAAAAAAAAPPKVWHAPSVVSPGMDLGNAPSRVRVTKVVYLPAAGRKYLIRYHIMMRQTGAVATFANIIIGQAAPDPYLGEAILGDYTHDIHVNGPYLNPGTNGRFVMSGELIFDTGGYAVPIDPIPVAMYTYATAGNYVDPVPGVGMNSDNYYPCGLWIQEVEDMGLGSVPAGTLTGMLAPPTFT